MSVIYRAACDLLFSQTSISSSFTDGDKIHDIIDAICSGRMSYQGFLPLEIFQDKYDNKWYCQNNRRLYMFRVLQKKGMVTQIPVKVVKSGRPKPPEAGPKIRFRDGTPTRPY